MKHKKIQLMSHVVVGYPDMITSEKIIDALVEGGSDIIEFQIPFSDPIADGPTIMKANEEALKNGVTIEDAFKLMDNMTKKYATPFFFMAYYNSIFCYGVEKFCKKAKAVGARGLIVPDLPPEEEAYELFLSRCKKYGLIPIRVLSLASTSERIKINVSIAEGFIYLVSRFGVTGVTNKLDERVYAKIQEIRKYTKLPIAVGFGISERSHVHALEKHADIAVVGSAIIELLKRNKSYENIQHFIETLREE